MKKNITQKERIVSGVAALSLIGLAVERFNKGKTPLGTVSLIGASALLWRSLSGTCPVYSALGVNKDFENSDSAVKTNAGIKVETSITIEKPAPQLFQFWKNLENLPKIMPHLKSVKQLDGKRSHWVVAGPLGRDVEWDAEIISESENEVIAWKSLEGSEVSNAGSVRFHDYHDTRGTEIRVNLKYDPPGGKLGAIVAKLFKKDAASEIESDLQLFKQLVESGQIANTQNQSSPPIQN